MITIDVNNSNGPKQLVVLVVHERPEYPSPKWKRTMFALPTGEVLIATDFFGMGTEDFVRQTGESRVQCATHENHFYIPTRWVMQVKPEFRQLCEEMEEMAREAIQSKLEG